MTATGTVAVPGATPDPQRTILLSGGQILHNVHTAETCTGKHCSIHNPSPHPLSTAPQFWQDELGLMLRRCSHGQLHPDRDDLAHKIRVMGVMALGYGNHLCDRCCTIREEIKS